ncbi:uncharacterized protein LOC124174025 [Ischnura elegans]|uniref:uncharacterized protein LOC124174025 n=1 Tax=Ischnura elegans TaxID=197161 RepID=UPI001ED87C5B|nr:uncharacterized protein LOC124174025 [Ischnura elegans]
MYLLLRDLECYFLCSVLLPFGANSWTYKYRAVFRIILYPYRRFSNYMSSTLSKRPASNANGGVRHPQPLRPGPPRIVRPVPPSPSFSRKFFYRHPSLTSPNPPPFTCRKFPVSPRPAVPRLSLLLEPSLPGLQNFSSPKKCFHASAGDLDPFPTSKFSLNPTSLISTAYPSPSLTSRLLSSASSSSSKFTVISSQSSSLASSKFDVSFFDKGRGRFSVVELDCIRHGGPDPSHPPLATPLVLVDFFCCYSQEGH